MTTGRHRRDDVRVEVERDRDGGVAEHLGDDLRMHASAKQDRRGRVAEVVEADPLEACALEDAAVRNDRWSGSQAQAGVTSEVRGLRAVFSRLGSKRRPQRRRGRRRRQGAVS